MFYVGRSTNCTRRLKQHLWDLKANRHTNPKLQNSFNKYGDAMFTFAVDCELLENDLVEFEQLVIDEGLASGKCFNINTNAEHGGAKGRIWTPEQIANVKAGQIASEFFAKTSLANQSAEDRQKALMKARLPENREKALATIKKNFGCPSNNFLQSRKKNHEDAVERTKKAIEWVMVSRESMSVANKKFHINQRMWNKVIPVWEQETGKVFDLPKKACGNRNTKHKNALGIFTPDAVYGTVKEASDALGICKSTIIYRCKHNVNGWSYINKNEEKNVVQR